MEQRDEFYVTLFSNDKTFESNILSAFENKLPIHFNLGKGNWRGGLSEIFLNEFLKTDVFNKETCVVIYIGTFDVFVTNPEDKLPKIKVEKYIGYTFYPVQKVHLNLNDWKLNFLPTLIQNITPVSGYTRNQVLQEFYTEILTYFGVAQNFDVKYSQIPPDKKAGLVRLTKTFDEEDFYVKPNHDYFVKTLVKELFEQKKNIKDFKNKLPEIFKQTIDFLKDELVYSDIIETLIYGSYKTQALRALNVLNCRAPDHAEFQNIHYIPINKNVFETIAIRICNQNGENINFQSSYTPTKIVLHFKKI